MIIPMNALNIDAACLGNHDLDFGLDQGISLIKRCNFPWLTTNFSLIEENSNDDESHLYSIPGCLEYKIIHKNGIKIGVMGLIEEE